MRIGIICDGDAESQVLRLLTKQVRNKNTYIANPVYANMQPKSSCKQIVKASDSAISLLKQQQVEKIIVIIDFEDKNDCCIRCVRELNSEYQKCYQDINLIVVIKYRRFENWLISDYKAVASLKKFAGIKQKARYIAPDKADHVEDATKLLNSICNGGEYTKRKDAFAICKKSNIDEMAKNSRSFRKFLRECNYQKYQRQSKEPYKAVSNS